MQPRVYWAPRTSLASIENTHNRSGGRVWPLAQARAVAERARALGLATHLDGARIWNASVASGVDVADMVRAVRHGERVLLEGARRAGGERVLRSAGARRGGPTLPQALGRRHAPVGHPRRRRAPRPRASPRASRRGSRQCARPRRDARAHARRCGWTSPRVETNMVNIDVDVPADAVVRARRRAGAAASTPSGPRRLRAVTHLDVSRADIDAAAEILGQAARERRDETARPLGRPASASSCAGVRMRARPSRGAAYDRAYAAAARAESAGRLAEARRRLRPRAPRRRAARAIATRPHWSAADVLVARRPHRATRWRGSTRWPATPRASTRPRRRTARRCCASSTATPTRGWRDMERRAAPLPVARRRARGRAAGSSSTPTTQGPQAGMRRAAPLSSATSARRELAPLVAFLVGRARRGAWATTSAARDAYLADRRSLALPARRVLRRRALAREPARREARPPAAAVDDLERLVAERETTSLMGSYERGTVRPGHAPHRATSIATPCTTTPRRARRSTASTPTSRTPRSATTRSGERPRLADGRRRARPPATGWPPWCTSSRTAASCPAPRRRARALTRPAKSGAPERVPRLHRASSRRAERATAPGSRSGLLAFLFFFFLLVLVLVEVFVLVEVLVLEVGRPRLLLPFGVARRRASRT